MRNSNPLWLFSALGCLSFLFVLDVISAADYVPTDKIFLNCGGPPDSTDSDGRKWTSDIGSKFALSTTKSSTAAAAIQKPSVPEVPYMTARIFQSEFTYSFPVASGRKFVRLYFYPASYNGLNASNAVFSVTSGAYTLLRNFSAALTTEALNYDYIMKEFSVNVPSEVLNVTFIPSQNASNSYAFVNGIEVVSHPDIYSTDGTEIVVGQSTGFNIDNRTALENVYRLNVGGNDISPSGDTGSPSYVAPLDVTTAEQAADVIAWAGMEIFKINDTTGNLAGPNPDPLPEPPADSSSQSSSASGKIIKLLLEEGLEVELQQFFLLVCWFCQDEHHGKLCILSPSNLCRHFSIAEIKAATNNFDEALLLGVGGFGKVYRGEIDSGTKVAINVGTHSLNKGCMNSKLRLKCSQNFATVT
ncbi:UNVERIFIED_CONTAM: Receptor-like protein kinase FERONIA [Sesamum radiatum]|uniref:Receptor-like protein kinase FERONIA n=1 Tax=Sesamum radiatum TaxID=300843 RepID=A0AAW2R660_SESRA